MSLFRSRPVGASLALVSLLASLPAAALPTPTQSVRPISAQSVGTGGAEPLKQAAAALRDKKPEEAKKLFEAALRADPRLMPAMLGLAEVAFLARNDAETLRWLQQAERAEPKSADVQSALGRYYLARKQPEKGEAALRKAVQLDAKALRPRLDLADALMLRGADAEALAMLREALQLDDKQKTVHLAMGQLHYRAGQAAEAEKALKRAVELDAKDPLPWLLQARAQKTAAAAMPLVDQALERDPKLYDALMLRAIWQLDTKNTSGAQESLKRAIDANPKAAEPHVRLGLLEEAAGRRQDAKRHYMAAIERDAYSAVALNNLVMMGLADKDDPVRLELMAKRAVKALPNNAQVLDTLALVQRERKDKAGALASAQAAVKLAPKDAGVRATLADMQMWNGDCAAAKASAEEVLKLEPQGPAATKAKLLLARL